MSASEKRPVSKAFLLVVLVLLIIAGAVSFFAFVPLVDCPKCTNRGWRVIDGKRVETLTLSIRDPNCDRCDGKQWITLWNKWMWKELPPFPGRYP